MGTEVLPLVLDRLSADWQAGYGPAVVVVERFVEPEGERRMSARKKRRASRDARPTQTTKLTSFAPGPYPRRTFLPTTRLNEARCWL